MANFARTWHQRYPKTCAFLQNALPGLPDRPDDIWRHFLKYSSLSEAAARKAIAPNGSFPEIWFRDLRGYDGYFRFESPNSIEINYQAAKNFEAASVLETAQDFILAKTLHEMVHWGLHPNEPTDAERGIEFEIAAFDAVLPRFWVAGSKPLTTEGLRNVIDHPQNNDLVLHPVASIEISRDLPRGIRNRNPGNIKRSSDQWEGLAEFEEMTEFQRGETTFFVFKEDKWGLRAMARLLRRYQTEHRLTTIQMMIGRWAPLNDRNDTLGYARFVSARVGVPPTAEIDFAVAAIAIPMMEAMIVRENGRQPYTNEQIRLAHEISA